MELQVFLKAGCSGITGSSSPRPQGTFQDLSKTMTVKLGQWHLGCEPIRCPADDRPRREGKDRHGRCQKSLNGWLSSFRVEAFPRTVGVACGSAVVGDQGAGEALVEECIRPPSRVDGFIPTNTES